MLPGMKSGAGSAAGRLRTVGFILCLLIMFAAVFAFAGCGGDGEPDAYGNEGFASYGELLEAVKDGGKRPGDAKMDGAGTVHGMLKEVHDDM